MKISKFILIVFLVILISTLTSFIIQEAYYLKARNEVLKLDDYAYYDRSKGSWVVGDYSNLPTGQEISRAKAKQIRGGAKRTVKRMGFANYLISCKEEEGEQITQTEAYKLAIDWEKRKKELQQKYESLPESEIVGILQSEFEIQFY